MSMDTKLTPILQLTARGDTGRFAINCTAPTSILAINCKALGATARQCLLVPLSSAPIQPAIGSSFWRPNSGSTGNSVAVGLFLRQTGVWRLVCLIHP